MISAAILCIVSGFVADYIIPYIKPVERFIESLPLGRNT